MLTKQLPITGRINHRFCRFFLLKNSAYYRKGPVAFTSSVRALIYRHSRKTRILFMGNISTVLLEQALGGDASANLTYVNSMQTVLFYNLQTLLHKRTRQDFIRD